MLLRLTPLDRIMSNTLFCDLFVPRDSSLHTPGNSSHRSAVTVACRSIMELAPLNSGMIAMFWRFEREECLFL